ncbi:hypothetical protein HU200_054994 [Digitaria exilis]|uniref:Leucine-rich repeat-containing N-terminal plant-type domain-containing protein n=1 Tax=Digitaria exilis TaxID=1010633 RepID=A0A835AK09_9POAL|nr:hypothetical protein HU200_054994 [Digitaria exilis]
MMNLAIVWLLLVSSLSSCSGTPSDIQCLRGLKESLSDPNHALSSWKLSENTTDGYTCEFAGVNCWKPSESKVLSLNLGNMGLRGPFPRALQFCTSMTALDLSGNNISGPLPADINLQLPFMTSLDLSNNSFSGAIPSGIGNMTQLAVRSHPCLSREVPAQDFAGNAGLCGSPPLDRKCKKHFHVRIRVRPVRIHIRLPRVNDASSIGAAAGFVAGFVVAFYFPHWLLLWLLLLSTSSSSSCFGSDLDITCLKTLKQSVIDPNGILESSWNFNNTTNGFICQFIGVECWNPNDSRVLALHLSNLGLEGQFPRGLEYCESLFTLDLSNNRFSGPIPSDITQQVTYLTFLDLSYNSFSGKIPVGICNMDLNVINIQHNQLIGQIPPQFDGLLRLTSLNVADNQLSGLIPSSLSKFPASNFSGNQGLCGPPLDDCGNANKPSLLLDMIDDESIIGAAVGFVVGFVAAFYFPHVFVFSQRLHPYVYRIC